jgi:hypothetical protein
MKTGTFLIQSCKYWLIIHTIGKKSKRKRIFLIFHIRNDYTIIMQHLWKKLNSKPKEWRRIFKALHAMEYLAKNGAPRCIQDIKDDLFKIRAL